MQTRTACHGLRGGRRVLALAALGLTWVLAAPAEAQFPAARVTGVYPLGGPRAGIQGPEAVVNLAITGTDLEDAAALRFNHPGITAAPKMETVTDGQGNPVLDEAGNPQLRPLANQFTVTIAPDVPPGLYELQAIGRYGLSNPRFFEVSDYPEIVETDPQTGPNNTAANATPITLGTIVNGRCEGGADVDFYRFSAAQGQRLIVDVWAQRLDSPMDPLVHLYRAGEQPVRLAYDDNTNLRDPLIDYTIETDGEYLLEIHDQQYRGGPEYAYRFRIGSVPYIDYVFPPSGPAGSNNAYTLYGRNLPGSRPVDGLTLDGRPLEQLTVNIELPADPQAQQRLEVGTFVTPPQAIVDGIDYRLPTPAGSSNPVRLHYAQATTVAEVEPNNEPAQAQPVSFPCELVGQFATRGDRDWITFELAAGQVCWIEAFGQRIGTPVDPIFVVQRVTTNDAGEEQVQEITVQDDNQTNIGGVQFNTITRDPIFRLAEAGTYRLHLRDLRGELFGDPSMVYRLALRPEQPDFRVVALPAFPVQLGINQTSPWPLFLRKGQNARMDLMVFRMNGFNRAVTVTVEGLPEGVTCPGATIGPDMTTAPLVFAAAENAADFQGPIRIVARAQVPVPAPPAPPDQAATQEDAAQAAEPPTQEVVREVRPATVVLGSQNNQSALARLAQETTLSVGAETAPFQISAGDGQVIVVERGQQIQLPVRVARRNGFNGAIALQAVGLPPNVQPQNININGDQTEAPMPIQFQDAGPTGVYSFYLQGQTQVQYSRAPDGSNPQAINVFEPSNTITIDIRPKPPQQ